MSQFGDQMQFLALPLLVVAITDSAAQAGLVLGAQTLVFLVFGIYAGALVDQWDRKRTMIWCDVGRAVLTAIVPIAYFGDFLAMALLYIVAIGNGILATLFSAANGSAPDPADLRPHRLARPARRDRQHKPDTAPHLPHRHDRDPDSPTR